MAATAAAAALSESNFAIIMLSSLISVSANAAALLKSLILGLVTT